MISPTNMINMVDNYKYMTQELDIPNVDYSLVRDDIWTDSDIEVFKEKITELAELYIKDINSGKRLSIGFFLLTWLDMIVSKKYGKRPFSCFSGYSGLGFMPDGFAYGCAKYGSNGELPIYDYRNDSWNNTSYNKLKDPKVCNPCTYAKCKDCSIYEYCNGGCNYNHIKNNYEPIESVCKLYKIIYKTSLFIFDELQNNTNFINMIKEGLKNNG